MSRWFRLSADLLNDATAQRLPGELFKAAFYAARAGQETALSPFMREGGERPSAEVWKRLRADVFQRDGYRCTYCGNGGRLECDHIVPVARGGSSDMDNLTTACRPCNRAKRDKLLSEWKQ
jgi:hypothetical protein